MSVWTKLPPVAAGGAVCLTCGCGAHETLPMDRHIAVGFGSAGFSRDDKGLWDENMCEREMRPEERALDDFPTVAHVEALAVADPDHDWRIYFFAPLYEATYQRHGDAHWVLVEKGQGFA